MLIAILLLLAGLTVLSFGGWILVRGAVGTAVLAKLSTPVIGLTVVAMGTSLPELAVSTGAAARGSTDMAFGNVVGSNIFNIGIVLAIAALLRPIPIHKLTVRREFPFMMIATIAVIVLGRDLIFQRIEGLFFVAALIGFTSYMVYQARTGVDPAELKELEVEIARTGVTPESAAPSLWLKNIAFLSIGIVALAGGANMMVEGGITIAEIFGVSGRIIGLTILAMGTSLPEVAATVSAALQDETDLVIGNVIGSNIFNLFGILGVTSLIFPVEVPPGAELDNVAMLAFSILLLPLLITRKDDTIRRPEGFILLALFAVYMSWVLLG